MKDKPKLLLLDGDIILFKCCAALEEETTFDGWLHIPWSDERAVRAAIDRTINKLMEDVQATEYVMCLSDKNNNFRKDVLPEYKANRKGNRKPYCYGTMYEEWLEYNETVVMPNLEADDVMGILATDKDYRPDCKKIICSIDKDMNTIPCWLYNWDNMEEETKVTQKSANLNFYTQVLTGDTVDNYKGCPTIGPKKAEAALENVLTEEEYWSIILELFEKKDLTEDDALVQARCARILRAEDWDKETKEVILWEP